MTWKLTQRGQRGTLKSYNLGEFGLVRLVTEVKRKRKSKMSPWIKT